MTNFIDLGLAAPLLATLETEGYVTPTPIQAQAIPAILSGRDLVGIAQTGTGKTAAFALPILHQLIARPQPAPRRGCRVLVLSPTRELATQIADSFRTYGKSLNLSCSVIFGGVPHAAQIRALARGIDILVATPGRLLDHMDAGNCVLGQTEFLVLDEVDQMLDLGFVKPIRRVVSMLPKVRQNLFFSATMPPEIGKLAAEFLTDPVKVSVAPAATTAERVQHQILLVETSRKRELLVELMNSTELTRTIIFTRTKRGADKVAKYLDLAGITAAAIHGNKSQSQRQNSLLAFRNGQVRALVATDIAARGIDIDAVSHVINFELPEVAESYVHRIGRTARAGAEGIAISLCDHEEHGLLRGIEKLTRINLPKIDRRLPAGSVLPAAAIEERRHRPSGRPQQPHGHAQAPGGHRDRDANNRSHHRPATGGAPRPQAARDGGGQSRPGSRTAQSR